MCRDIKAYYSACKTYFPLLPTDHCELYLLAQAIREAQGREISHYGCPEYILSVVLDLRPEQLCPACTLYFRESTGQSWHCDASQQDAGSGSVLTVGLQWWQAASRDRFMLLPPHMTAMQYTGGSWWHLRPREQSQTRPAISIASPPQSPPRG